MIRLNLLDMEDLDLVMLDMVEMVVGLVDGFQVEVKEGLKLLVDIHQQLDL